MQFAVWPLWIYLALSTRLHGNVWYRSFSLTWPAAILVQWNKRKYLHKNKVQYQYGRRSPTSFPEPFPWQKGKGSGNEVGHSLVLVHQHGRRDVMWKRSITNEPIRTLTDACCQHQSWENCVGCQNAEKYAGLSEGKSMQTLPSVHWWRRVRALAFHPCVLGWPNVHNWYEIRV